MNTKMRHLVTALLTLLISTLIILLSGCSVPHPNKAPPPVEFVSVNKEVAVPCIDPKDIPDRPASVGGQLDGNAQHDASILAGALIETRIALDKTFALITGCVQLKH